MKEFEKDFILKANILEKELTFPLKRNTSLRMEDIASKAVLHVSGITSGTGVVDDGFPAGRRPGLTVVVGIEGLLVPGVTMGGRGAHLFDSLDP